MQSLARVASVSASEVDGALAQVNELRGKFASDRDAVVDDENELQDAIVLQKLKIELAAIDAEASAELLALNEQFPKESTNNQVSLIQAKSKARTDAIQLKIRQQELRTMTRKKSGIVNRRVALDRLLSLYGEPGTPVPETDQKPSDNQKNQSLPQPAPKAE